MVRAFIHIEGISFAQLICTMQKGLSIQCNLSSKGTKYCVIFVSRGRFKCLKLIHANGFVEDCKQADRTKFNSPNFAKMELGNQHFSSTAVDYQGVAIAQRSKPLAIIVQKNWHGNQVENNNNSLQSLNTHLVALCSSCFFSQ